MRYTRPRAPIGRPWLPNQWAPWLLLAGGLAALGCDGSDRVILTPASGAAPADPTAPDAQIVIDGFTAVGACAMELPACEDGSGVACTLRCGTRPSGCVAYAEFVPLAANDDEAYSLRWGPIDPEGRWAFYQRELVGGRRESTLYRWSIDGGDAALVDLLGLAPADTGAEEALVLVEVGAGGDAILLLGLADEVANHGYVWTREAGLARLDFVPWDMSADGGVVVGARGGRAVVWNREAGTRRLDGAALDAPPISVEGTVPDAMTQRTSVRWIRVSDSGRLVLSVENSGYGFRWGESYGVMPLDGLPGFPRDVSVELADLESGAIVASRNRSEREPIRLWWWRDAVGATELGTLPDQESSFRRSASLLRAGGTVIIGDEASSYGEVAVFRWSEELGTERVSPPSMLSRPLYVNPEATTLVGTASIGVQRDTFRWTARDGVSLLPEAAGTSLVALGGDVLVVPGGAVDAGDAAPGSASGAAGSDAGAAPAPHRVLKFDAARELGEALPIELIAAGLVPYRDALAESIQLVSENARLLAGTLRDARGTSRAWVLRLRDTCDPP